MISKPKKKPERRKCKTTHCRKTCVTCDFQSKFNIWILGANSGKSNKYTCNALLVTFNIPYTSLEIRISFATADSSSDIFQTLEIRPIRYKKYCKKYKMLC